MYQENLFQSRSKKINISFICQIIFEECFIKAIEDLFRVSVVSSKHSGKLGEFSTVIQTQDAVEGLHNCRKFSLLSNSPNFPSCLDEAMETRKTSSIA